VMTIKTDNAGTSLDNQFTLPATGTYDVDWGDGTIETGLTGAQTHTYANIGTYDIRVSNGITSCIFNAGGDKKKPIEVKQWGTGEWNNMIGAFLGCSNITKFPDDPIPAWSSVTSLELAWTNCSSTTTVSPVFNLINVTDLRFAWASCSSLTTAPNVSTLTKVTRLFGAWEDCTQLLEVPNITSLINVTNLDRTWQNLPLITELPLIGFHIENVTSAITMAILSNNITTANYDAILIDFHTRLEGLYPSGVGYPNSGLVIHFGDATYTIGSAAETARTALINDFGWVLTDGGGI